MAGSLGTATVMGAGAWGTAIAKVAADAGNDVRLWARTAAVADEINSTRRNTDYLGDVELPSTVHATTDAAEALGGCDDGAAGGAVADAAREPGEVDAAGRRPGRLSSAWPRASNWAR